MSCQVGSSCTGRQAMWAGAPRRRWSRAGSAQCSRAVTGAGVLLEPGYAFRGGRIVGERSAAHVTSFDIDGTRRQGFSIGSSEQFALPRLRPGTAADGAPAQASLTDVDVYLGWFGGATRLVQAASALVTPLGRLAGVHRVLDEQSRRIQRSRAQPSAEQSIRSDVVAVASDAGGRKLAAVHLSGGDPYSFTAPVLAWAARTAAARGVRPAGALGPVEAFGLADLKSACADAGFSRAPVP
jgi:hypothetical protein